MSKIKLKYKRILLKLSGEMLKGDLPSGIDEKELVKVVKKVKELVQMGVNVAIVIGGGNIWRFRDFKSMKLSRVTSDTMGMLATMMNSLALAESLEDVGVKTAALSLLPCEKVFENYNPKLAKKYLSEGRVVIFAGGTGHAYFTTDSAAAVTALQTSCDALFKATKVDYVYDKDPMKYKNAKKYEKLSYEEIINKKLNVMDLTCASLCREGKIPMLVFNFDAKDCLKKAVSGIKIGTLIN